MADKLPTKTRPPLKTPPIPNIEAPYENEKVWQYKQRILQAQINKGSRYPPFNIEPVPWERMRVAKPMTDLDRQLRKQWFKDQKFGPGDYKYIPDAQPKANIRRMWGMPMDYAGYGVFRATGSMRLACLFRVMVPKMLFAYAFAVSTYYYFTYKGRTWEGADGPCVYRSNISKMMGDQIIMTEKAFGDMNFSNRNKDLNLPSSTVV